MCGYDGKIIIFLDNKSIIDLLARESGKIK